MDAYSEYINRPKQKNVIERLDPSLVEIEEIAPHTWRVNCKSYGAYHTYASNSKAIEARERHLFGNLCSVDPQTGKARQ